MEELLRSLNPKTQAELRVVCFSGKPPVAIKCLKSVVPNPWLRPGTALWPVRNHVVHHHLSSTFPDLPQAMEKWSSIKLRNWMTATVSCRGKLHLYL